MRKLKIVIFNIRTLYSHPIDGACSFIHRAGMILEKIRKEQPHIICFQEVSDNIRPFLRNYLNDYIVLGHGRDKNLKCEALSIAYRKDSMELLFFENFWLSPTPYIPGSRYEIQSEYSRICPHIVLKHYDMDTPVSLYNVHLDHISDEARVLGIHQITDFIADFKKKMDCPTFILGDFNATPESETIRYIKSYNNSEFVELSEGKGNTFHGFRDSVAPRNSERPSRDLEIDYIFADKATSQKSYSVTKWKDSENGIFLSDHYPLCLEIEL